MIDALLIQVSGIVQGVGFRPFIYRLAKHYLVNGWVLNSIDGVTIHAEAESQLLDEFVLEIANNAPAAARVDEITMKEVPLEGFTKFEIRFSEKAKTEKTTLVSPDLATCADCEAELFDPHNRRYRYPFINCTNCGPRFTIIRGLPYDRAKTSMAAFEMCPLCSHEYADPGDRRFHAQPDACFECGPHICLIDLPVEGEKISDLRTDSRVLWGDNRQQSDLCLAKAVEALRLGKIVALKGLGGFHLACDAKNDEAVARLRERKRRPVKPLAVMFAGVDQVKEHCCLSPEEEKLLTSAQRPIVLLKKHQTFALSDALAGDLPELGAMLPATPLQMLLLHDFGGAVVMTSGNIHGAPIETDDILAIENLGHIADVLVGNDRPILSRYDDSVVRIIQAGSAGPTVQTFRRARGMAPLPLPFPYLKDADDSILACGSEQKNTLCLARKDEAFVSQHIGDMESVQVNDGWFEAKQTYEHVFDIHPKQLACDKHPEYLASKWARSQALPCTEVQHHHAHIVSVMAENSLEGPVCGFSFDGTGFGEDGAVWGGEVLLSNLQTFERFANFAYFPLPGAAAAIEHPMRCAYGALWAFDLLDHPAAQKMIRQMGEQADICQQMIDNNLNCPQTSSVGRLFDAASALLGICTDPTYEGEAAIALEAAMAHPEGNCCEETSADYRIDIVKNVALDTSTALDTSILLLDAAPLFRALLDDFALGIDRALIARRFHEAFIDAIVCVAQLVEATYDIRTVVCSGGVFMNRFIIEGSLSALERAGFTVAINRDLPPNDGNVSYGQAVVAASRV